MHLMWKLPILYSSFSIHTVPTLWSMKKGPKKKIKEEKHETRPAITEESGQIIWGCGTHTRDGHANEGSYVYMNLSDYIDGYWHVLKLVQGHAF